MTTPDQFDRLSSANAVIAAIAAHGRRFFHHKGRFAALGIDVHGHITHTDEYSDKTFRITNPRAWNGFSHGGTMRSLIEALADYIRTGEPIDRDHFGPWPDDFCRGDLWGYGKDAMEAVRAALSGNPAVSRPSTWPAGAQVLDPADFLILDQTEGPEVRNIVLRLGADSWRYLSVRRPDNLSRGATFAASTPVADFGMRLCLDTSTGWHRLYVEQRGAGSATYDDGKPRAWQDKLVDGAACTRIHPDLHAAVRRRVIGGAP